MPLTLTVAARAPRFVDIPSFQQEWRQLHAVADAAYPELRTLWMVVFADYSTDLDTAAMRDALRSGNLLAVERLIAPAWRAVLTRCGCPCNCSCARPPAAVRRPCSRRQKPPSEPRSPCSLGWSSGSPDGHRDLRRDADRRHRRDDAEERACRDPQRVRGGPQHDADDA